MINYIYELATPGIFSVKYEDMNIEKSIIVKPEYMAVCHADQRYYRGQRDVNKLKSKLPMALIHECMGSVVSDYTGTYKSGQKVVLIPNVKSKISQEGIYENYQKGSAFLSSGKDGFMREFVNLPLDRVVPIGEIPGNIAAISEFISVGAHAVRRFKNSSHNIKNSIGIWGDGSLAYVLSCIIKSEFPGIHLTVIGRDPSKLSQFTFVDNTYLSYDIPKDFNIDHAFECAGGEGSFYAIDDIIRYINPQGSVMLLGVSENKVAINTRDVLEKGLTLVGCSRSGREDFEQAVKLLEKKSFQNRIKRIIYEDLPVSSIEDIYRVFETDASTAFKTVFKWNL